MVNHTSDVDEQTGEREVLQQMSATPTSYTIEPVNRRYVQLTFEDEEIGLRVEVSVEHPTADSYFLRLTAGAALDAAMDTAGSLSTQPAATPTHHEYGDGDRS